MPMIDLYCQEGCFTPEAKDRLVEELTALLLKMEGAPDNLRSRALSWMFIHALPAGAVHTGGKVSTDFRYKVIFSVPEGTRGLHGPLCVPRREEMFAAATKLILAAEGADDTPANRFRVWCFLHEVPEATWAGMGLLVRMEDIASFVRDTDKPTPVAAQVKAMMAGQIAAGGA